MIIYAGLSKWFTWTDNDCTQNLNYAFYSVFGTNSGDGVDHDLNNDCLNGGQIVDNVVQWSPCAKLIETSEYELNADWSNEGQIVDNVVQRSPCAKLIEISDNELETDCLNKGRIIDNVVQRSPGVKMIVCKNDFEKSCFS